MNRVWLFIEKGHDGKITRTATYGSLRALNNNESVVVGASVKSEAALRYMLKKNNDKYSDARYHIEKKEIIREKHFPI